MCRPCHWFGAGQGKEVTQAALECYILFIMLKNSLSQEMTATSNSRRYTLQWVQK